MTKKQQREFFQDCFDSVNEESNNDESGKSHMLQWASDNPTEFYKLYAKLAPPIKIDSHKDNHESFIMLMMQEEKLRQKQLGKPQKLIDVDINTIDD